MCRWRFAADVGGQGRPKNHEGPKTAREGEGGSPLSFRLTEWKGGAAAQRRGEGLALPPGGSTSRPEGADRGGAAPREVSQ
jgi:hypothetical protein